MGRHRKLRKLSTTTMQVYEKFIEEERAHKSRSLIWADYIVNSFAKLRELEGKENDYAFYLERCIKLSEAVEAYASLVKQISHMETIEQVMSILKHIMSSDGIVEIGKYKMLAKTYNFVLEKEVN